MAIKGSRSIHSIIPDSKEWLTVLSSINAAGETIPNFYIFKGMRRKRDYIKKCEPFATCAMQSNAWMNAYLFNKWMDHFIEAMKKKGGMSPIQRHLMILDGHNSHVILDVIVKANEAGLDMVTLPSHTSHEMQPLDVAVFKPFKTAFRAYRDIWNMIHKGQKTMKEDLVQWVSLALKKAMTPSNIRAGFRRTGIWPLNNTAMTNKIGPSEGFIEKSLDVQINEILEEDVSSTQEDLVHYYVDVEGEESPSSQECGSENGPQNHFSHFLRLPQQEVRPPRVRNEPLIDYSKSHILTSEQYVESAKAIAEKVAQAKDATVEKKKETTLKAAKKVEEKLQKAEENIQKEKDKEAKKIFKEKWTPTAISEAGEKLQRLMKEGCPTIIHIPYFGMCPEQCKTNQQVAMSKLKAKRAFIKDKIPIPSFPPMLELPWTHGWQQHCIWFPQLIRGSSSFVQQETTYDEEAPAPENQIRP
jgi:hypothetical protein